MTVSVVVPTVGHYSMRGVLDALAHQDGPPPFEVIVSVDGRAEPDFAGVTVHPQCKRLVLVQLGSPQGVSVARNRGVEQACGDLIGFLDDDTIPEPDWLNRLSKDLSGGETAVAGRIIEKTGTSTLSRLRALAFEYRHKSNLVKIANGSNEVDYLNGGNCGFRAAHFRDLGGFDPAFRKSQDRDLARRAVLAGYRVIYAPDLVITHAATYTVRAFIRGRFRAGRAALVMKRLSGSTSVGPTRLRATYGAGLLTLTMRYGPTLAVAALVSIVAHRLGWITGALRGAEGNGKGPGPEDPAPPVVREIQLPTRG